MSGAERDRGMPVGAGRGRYDEGSEPAKDGQADVEPMRSHEHEAGYEHHEYPEALASEPAKLSGADRHAGTRKQRRCADGNDDARAVTESVEEGRVRDKHGQDYEGSVYLTLLMPVALVLCGLKGGGLWSRLGFFTSACAFGIGVLWFPGWKLGGYDDEDTGFIDCRSTLVVFGFGGGFFGSAEDCVPVGGVLAIGAIVAASADYRALAAVSRRRECSLAKAFRLLLARPPQRRRVR